ncbi:RES domain-containing protein [Rhizobium rhizophilum]|uniref:RES domain-containing protein n=2 Tax=Rhizobium rhizophilum TaxID=1850373 RepID=A0ABY2QV24_9HYPH|nr:RES domain-containing protein [Rhizobium rhizophilum]
MDTAALADITWHDQIKSSGEAKTQAFARQLVKDDYHGLLVRSFVHDSSPSDLNLALWQWGGKAPLRLIVIDDENPLA